MLLAKLFWSKCRAKILETFVVSEAMRHDTEGFFIRELSREIAEQLNGVRRELMNLESLGILTSKDVAKKRIYRLNKKCSIYRELMDIFLKSYDAMGKLESFFKTKRTLDLIAVSQSVGENIESAQPLGVVDIFLIGDIDRIEFNNFIEKTFFGRKIKYAVMTKDDFLYRLEYSDKLVLSILSQSGMRILRDRMDIADVVEKKLREQEILQRRR